MSDNEKIKDQDRRQFIRIEKNNLLAYVRFGRTGLKETENIGRTENISKGGVLFVSGDKFNENDSVRLEIVIDDETIAGLKGKVKRVRYNEDENLYYVGVEFGKVSFRESIIINNLVEQFQNK